MNDPTQARFYDNTAKVLTPAALPSVADIVKDSRRIAVSFCRTAQAALLAEWIASIGVVVNGAFRALATINTDSPCVVLTLDTHGQAIQEPLFTQATGEALACCIVTTFLVRTEM